MPLTSGGLTTGKLTTGRINDIRKADKKKKKRSKEEKRKADKKRAQDARDRDKADRERRRQKDKNLLDQKKADEEARQEKIQDENPAKAPDVQEPKEKGSLKGRVVGSALVKTEEEIEEIEASIEVVRSTLREQAQYFANIIAGEEVDAEALKAAMLFQAEAMMALKVTELPEFTPFHKSKSEKAEMDQ